MVSKQSNKKKKKKKKKTIFFFFLFLIGKTGMVLGKKVAIFDWEWGRNSAPREWQKMPCRTKRHLFNHSFFQPATQFMLGNIMWAKTITQGLPGDYTGAALEADPLDQEAFII